MQLGDVADSVRELLDRSEGGPGRGDERAVRERLPSVTRRRVLGTGAAVAGARAADNVLVGYGILTGTNLQAQDVGALATEHLGPSPFATAVGGTSFSLAGRAVNVDGQSYDLTAVDAERARAADREHGLAAPGERGPVAELAADWEALGGTGPAADPTVAVEPQAVGSFFETVRDADARPFTVAALRGSDFEPAAPETVRAVTDTDRGPAADPAVPESVVVGLKRGFNERTSYDGPRYLAGSVEDNVLMRTVELREHFEDPVTFDALLDQRDSGMFCYEFVHRSVDALHAVPAHRQTTPVLAGVVTDRRHKHVYTVIASAYRRDGELVVPLAFVDYTHSTLYDDVGADAVLGEGLEAYNSRHRASEIYWNRYAIG